MSNQTVLTCLGATLLWLASNSPVQAADPVDCACVSNLSVLITNGCPAFIPDIRTLATNCYSTNVNFNDPNAVIQLPPPGSPASAGTNAIFLTVTDNQANWLQCEVEFVVIQPPNPSLTLVCAPDKTVECGSGWSFDQPVIASTCCDPFMAVTILGTVTNGTCPQILTRTWKVNNVCGQNATCSQTVTVVDNQPPRTLCDGFNLVPNGDFESFTSCPSSSSQFDLAAPWYTPSDGTSDYYHSCAGPASPASTPTNAVGVQLPLSGQGYGGAFVYGDDGTNPYREYLQVPLLLPLTGGQTYLVSFHVSRAENYGNAIAEIGAHFSVGPVVSNGYWGVLNVVPQVVNPATNILAATNSWMLVQGSFVASGGETHLTLGNFLADGATTVMPAAGLYPNLAYYYFEDVSVQMVCSPTVTNQTVFCGQPWGFDEPVVFDECGGTNVAIAISTTTNGPCPLVVTRNWNLTDACGNTTNWTQTVTVQDNQPPLVLCGNAPELVPNGQFELLTDCPTNFSQLALAPPWYPPTDATPDLYHTCSGSTNVGVPTNYFGVQAPFSGNGFAGLYAAAATGFPAATSYREYLQVPLQSPLVAGQTYVLSYRASLSSYSGYAIAELGAHFSAGPVMDGMVNVLNVTPQIVNPSGNVLTNTDWTLLQSLYTATGGETHLTLGCFLSDAAVTLQPILPNATNDLNGPSDIAYYYIDDVSLQAVACTLPPEVVLPCGAPIAFPELTALDACGGPVTTVITTVTNACPFSVTRVWSFSDACGNTTNVSQTILIPDNEPPVALCTGTNLVPNPSFENHTNCPNDYSQLAFAVPWYPATDGTPDFFHACNPFGSVGMPTNWFGSQTPFLGQGHAGAYVRSPGANYREYLQTPLSTPLLAGQTYAVSFRVSLADISNIAISQIGAHFSVGPVTSGNNTPLNVVPQVVNSATNFLTDTNGWMLIQGNYTALGGETHLTLGNFLDDGSTAFTNASGDLTGWSYYHFDEVYVGFAGNCLPEELSVACGDPVLFPPVTAYDACAGTNVTTTFTDLTNNVCPLVITRTWTFADPCGNSTNLSQTVFVFDPVPPVVDEGCLLAALEPFLVGTGCPDVIPDFSFLTNSPCITDDCGPIQIIQNPPAGTPIAPGVHAVNLYIGDCSTGVNLQVNFTLLPRPVGGLFCPPDIYLTACPNGFALANYTVEAFANLGPVTCIPSSGTAFPIGTNVVVCTATNVCGDVVSCLFNVIVRPGRPWVDCFTKHIGVKTTPMGTAVVRYVPNFGDENEPAVEFAELGSSGLDGARLEFGPVAEFGFTTVLDFTAPPGARVDLRVPPGHGEASGQTLLTLLRGTNFTDGWEIRRPRPLLEPSGSLTRAIAIGTNGVLFDSVTHTAAELDTNVIATVAPMNGMTSAVLAVTLDARTRALTLAFPHCEWETSARHKGWDGCIYGPDRPRPTKTNTTARLIITPPAPQPLLQLTSLDLVTSNLLVLPFEAPLFSTATNGSKWGAGYVIIMKAFDDGTDAGVELISLGESGGAQVELGYAADFQLQLRPLDNGPVAQPEQIFRVIGGGPRALTNRPAPPKFDWRLTQVDDGSGVPAVELAADFTQWGVSNVTVQLWNGSTLVAETNHVPATLTAPLASLSKFPEIMGSPALGILRLASTNSLHVQNFPGCGGLCNVTEVRVLAELEADSAPPAASTDLEIVLAEGMALQILDLQTTPACMPVPVHVTASADGISLSWEGDGFRLEGAERVTGPWYDLGVRSPAVLPANSTLRLFRLRCY